MTHRMDFTEQGFEDEIVVGSWQPNADGSITVEACINVYGPNGLRWGTAGVRIRLLADSAESRKFARKARKG
ncbi:MAG: hypothetical protein E6R03_04440 [Hyphomicrobiaceae bacterium]|nr:MAG: hypothetical protein E6R03_04440 [Hyphomicrobiaceae bacterium]